MIRYRFTRPQILKALIFWNKKVRRFPVFAPDSPAEMLLILVPTDLGEGAEAGGRTP